MNIHFDNSGTGFGDIYARGFIARMMVSTEMIVSIIYQIVIIGLGLSLLIQRQDNIAIKEFVEDVKEIRRSKSPGSYNSSRMETSQTGRGYSNYCTRQNQASPYYSNDYFSQTTSKDDLYAINRTNHPKSNNVEKIKINHHLSVFPSYCHRLQYSNTSPHHHHSITDDTIPYIPSNTQSQMNKQTDYGSIQES